MPENLYPQTLSYKTAAKKLNDVTYSDFYYRLMLMARTVFHWENLPNGIDEKWIEKFLFYHGKCMIYKDPKLGLTVAQTTETNSINEYGEPTFLTPHFESFSGTEDFSPTIKEYQNNKECILIRNNDIMLPTQYSINLFAVRLTDIQRTIDVNIAAQKTPTIVLCSDRQIKSFKATMNQKQDNEIVIYGNKDLENLGDIKTLDVEAPIVFDKLQIQKHTLWNECMTFLGVNNANMDKRERLVDDEVQANNEQIELSAQIMLKARQRACEQINELFKENVKVSLRTPQKAITEEIEGTNNE